ncbi:MAG: hypothetical protein CMJ81_23835 [Planctomycetaceae bacterium]|nr:hypothetical protein [Planctomycetaceae bacterium]MBP63251.1 hypothetical protein [Planctomycetaceae bacterium]
MLFSFSKARYPQRAQAPLMMVPAIVLLKNGVRAAEPTTETNSESQFQVTAEFPHPCLNMAFFPGQPN